LKGGTVSARAGPHASIPHIAARIAGPIIRIVDSIFAGASVERRCGDEKNGQRVDGELSAGVAVLHLTSFGLRGTVRNLHHLADCPCATCSRLFENSAFAQCSA
jgi:hypothetical protein